MGGHLEEERFRKESHVRVEMGSSVLELEILHKYLLEDRIASLFKPLVASSPENMFSIFPGKLRCIFAIGRTLSKTQNNKNHKKSIPIRPDYNFLIEDGRT